MNPTPEGDRGQLMLLAGVVLALVFVVLGVLLNSAAFTGAEAARGGASDAGDALSVREDAVEGVGGALFYANYYNYAGGDDSIRDVLRSDVRNWNDVLSADSAAHRTISRVELQSTTDGTQVYQNRSRDFTPVSNNSDDWQPAEDATGVRRFEMDVSADSLHWDDDETDAFHIELKTDTILTDGQFHLVQLHEDNGDVIVSWRGNQVTNGDCDTERGSVTIDITAGEIPGTDCNLPASPALNDSFVVEFDNPTGAEGRYTLVTDGTVSDSEFNDYGAGTGPYHAPALYNATVEVTHRSATVAYVSNVTVAPEDTPIGPVFDVSPSPPRELVYAIGTESRLHSIDPVDKSVTAYTATDVAVIGPMTTDLDSDDRAEAPYVNESGALNIIDRRNETQTLVPPDAVAAEAPVTQNGLLAVGRWDGATSVFYATENGEMYRVRPGANPSKVPANQDGNGIGAVAGIDDMNQNDVGDILSADASQQLRFFEPGSDDNVKVDSGGVGQNYGIGMGAPYDFNGDGAERAPMVDGSANLYLINQGDGDPNTGIDGKTDTFLTSESVKAPLTGVEWNDSMDGLEVVFVGEETVDGSTERVLMYVPYSGGEATTITRDGSPIPLNESVGVA